LAKKLRMTAEERTGSQRPSTCATDRSARTSRSARSHRSSRSCKSDWSEYSETGSAYKDDPAYKGHCWVAHATQSTLPCASDSLYRKPAKVMPAPSRANGFMSINCNPSYVGHVRGKNCENIMGVTFKRANQISSEKIAETDILGGCRNVPPSYKRALCVDKHGLPALKGGLNTHRLFNMKGSPYTTINREERV